MIKENEWNAALHCFRHHMEFSGVSMIYYVHHVESKNKVAELDWRTQFFSSVGKTLQINFQATPPLQLPAVVAFIVVWAALAVIQKMPEDICVFWIKDAYQHCAYVPLLVKLLCHLTHIILCHLTLICVAVLLNRWNKTTVIWMHFTLESKANYVLQKYKEKVLHNLPIIHISFSCLINTFYRENKSCSEHAVSANEVKVYTRRYSWAWSCGVSVLRNCYVWEQFSSESTEHQDTHACFPLTNQGLELSCETRCNPW